ncbi:hypothetical protein RFI_04474, partial [Reticulomyxa filosa]
MLVSLIQHQTKQDFVIEDSEDEVVTEKMKKNNKGMNKKISYYVDLDNITTITHTIKDIDKSDTDTSAVHLEQIDDDNQSEPEMINDELLKQRQYCLHYSQQYEDWTEKYQRYFQQEKDEKKIYKVNSMENKMNASCSGFYSELLKKRKGTAFNEFVKMANLLPSENLRDIAAQCNRMTKIGYFGKSQKEKENVISYNGDPRNFFASLSKLRGST